MHRSHPRRLITAAIPGFIGTNLALVAQPVLSLLYALYPTLLAQFSFSLSFFITVISETPIAEGDVKTACDVHFGWPLRILN